MTQTSFLWVGMSVKTPDGKPKTLRSIELGLMILALNVDNLTSFTRCSCSSVFLCNLFLEMKATESMHSDCKLAAIDVTYLKMIHATPPDM